MRILIYSTKSTFSSSSFGGAERSLTTMAMRLGERGHDVALVTVPPNGRISKSRVINENSFNVHFLPVIRLPFLRYEFIKYLNKGINSILTRNYLNRHFSHFDISYSFTEDPDTLLLLNWKEKYSLKIKVIIRSVGLFWEKRELNEKILSHVVHSVYSNVDSVCFIQDKQKMSFEKMCADKFRVKLKDSFVQDIGNEINKELKQWQPSPKSKFRIFMMGRFTSDSKRQDIIIEAFKSLGIEDSELVFAGEGSTMLTYERLCRNDIFLSDRVKFLGFINKDKLHQTFLDSSLFCLVSDSEGLCKSVLEAMSTGIPVLVSDVKVLNDYVIHNQNGLLAKNSVEDWIAQLKYFRTLSCDVQLRIGNRGKQFVYENYDSQVCGLKLENEFERLIRDNLS